jgi:hypothetical protein
MKKEEEIEKKFPTVTPHKIQTWQSEEMRKGNFLSYINSRSKREREAGRKKYVNNQVER